MEPTMFKPRLKFFKFDPLMCPEFRLKKTYSENQKTVEQEDNIIAIIMRID